MNRRAAVPLALLALACGRTDPLEFDQGGLGPGGAAGMAGSGVGAEGGAAFGGFGGDGGAGGAGFGGEGGAAAAGGVGAMGGVGGVGGSAGVCDQDADGFEGSQCNGSDCNDLNASVFPGAPEVCTDAADNDCNAVSDCFDPACVGVPQCGCVPVPESCTNGLDDDCDTIVDCFDADCAGTPVCGCAPSETGACTNGFDDDCDGRIDCEDFDCSGTPACTCRAQPERCSNRTDDDCDLLIDCADPDCVGREICRCPPPGFPEQCANGSDDDCDGLVDCADPNCFGNPACAMCVPEKCGNGLDDDCDGRIDCADSGCFLDPACPVGPEICNNGLDDDFDGEIDCADSDCRTTPVCVVKQGNCSTAKLITASGTYTGDTTGDASDTEGECGGAAGEAVFRLQLSAPTRVHLDTNGTSFDSTLYVRKGSCTAGKEIGCDDDSGGVNRSASLDFVLLAPGSYFVFVDGFTVDPTLGPDEGPFALNVDLEPNPRERCDDGEDNDGDQYVDCADPDCTSVGRCASCNAGMPARAEFGVGACTNGRDDDCDGFSDCADQDCSLSDYYVTECCNGLDQNGNGTPDDFNCHCATNADCIGGQICYGHSVFACGPPCGQFVGDVCPFVAPGSTCSPATNQCEF